MPLQKAKGQSKKAVQQAISANVRELKKEGHKKRPLKQILAIAISAAKRR